MSPRISHYDKAADELLRNLPERTQEILRRRYGLGDGDAETLEKIGQDFGVTRERIRQIEAAGLRELRSAAHEVVESIFAELERHLDAHGSVRAEHYLHEDFSDNASPEALSFFLDLGEPFSRHRETDHRHPVWSTKREYVKDAEAFERALVQRLKSVGEELEEAAFWDLVEDEARKRRLELSRRAMQSWVGVSRNIMQGPTQTWGLRDWEGVAPRNVGDWAFIVLREAKEPLHFSDIVEQMNSLRGESEEWGEAITPRNRKPAHLQTVHNELIKDERFVLVGRGIYALRDWGYQPGTVKDVIEQILQEAKRPLTREEIIAKVSEVRRVQPNTILLNLQNRSLFSRTPEGGYTSKR
jgi:hypothetical protein